MKVPTRRCTGCASTSTCLMHVCTTCQRNKIAQLQPIGLLQPLPVWADIRINFIEGLPKVNGR
jgi:hypothetical protein